MAFRVWSFYSGQVSYEHYMRQLTLHRAHYDPRAWAASSPGRRPIRRVDRRHHDGVPCGTRPRDLTSCAHAGGRDCRSYVPPADRVASRSLLLHSDWSHPTTPPSSIRRQDDLRTCGSWPPTQEDPELAALLAYRTAGRRTGHPLPPDLLCSTASEHSGASGHRHARDQILPASDLPQRRCSLAAATPLPSRGCPSAPGGPWELCLTINDSWGSSTGRQPQVLSNLVRTSPRPSNGRTCADVGPREDGTSQPNRTERSKIGAYPRHGESLRTTAGLPAGYHYGPPPFRRRRTLYLVCFDAPRKPSRCAPSNHIQARHRLGPGGTRPPLRRLRTTCPDELDRGPRHLRPRPERHVSPSTRRRLDLTAGGRT